MFRPRWDSGPYRCFDLYGFDSAEAANMPLTQKFDGAQTKASRINAFLLAAVRFLWGTGKNANKAKKLTHLGHIQ